MAKRKVPYGTSPLFPELEIKESKKPRKKAVVKVKKKVSEPDSNHDETLVVPQVSKEQLSPMLVLLFPELYPSEFEVLNRELELATWDCVTDDQLLMIQWHMMTEFEDTWSKDDSAKEHYIDYAMWVILENETDETNPFSFRNVVRATYGIHPDKFAAAVALRIWYGANRLGTKSGQVFAKIRRKYEKDLSCLIVKAGFTL